MSASRENVLHVSCEMRSWQLQTVNTMCASVGGSNTAAQASGQKSVVGMANESTVKSHVAPAAMLGKAVSGAWGRVGCVCVAPVAARYFGAGDQDLLHCRANCEVSRESGTYPDSVKSW